MVELANWISRLEAALGDTVANPRELPPAVVSRSMSAQNTNEADCGEHRMRKTIQAATDSTHEVSTDEALVPLVDRVETWLSNLRSRFAREEPAIQALRNSDTLPPTVVDRVEMWLARARKTHAEETTRDDTEVDLSPVVLQPSIVTNVGKWLSFARARVAESEGEIRGNNNNASPTEERNGWRRPTYLRGAASTKDLHMPKPSAWDDSPASENNRTGAWCGLRGCGRPRETRAAVRIAAPEEDSDGASVVHSLPPGVSEWLEESIGKRRLTCQDETYEFSRQRNKSIVSRGWSPTAEREVRNVAAPAPVLATMRTATLNNLSGWASDEEDDPEATVERFFRLHDVSDDQVSFVGSDVETPRQDEQDRESPAPRRTRITIIAPDDDARKRSTGEKTGFARQLRATRRMSAVSVLRTGEVHLGAMDEVFGSVDKWSVSSEEYSFDG